MLLLSSFCPCCFCFMQCVAPDYLLVHEAVADKFLKLMLEALKVQYGKDDPAILESMGCIVQVPHAQRQVELIQEAEHSGQCVVLGGGSAACRAEVKKVAPTFLLNPPRSCCL
mmetsp:Transcript_29770/g.68718  ORF Transcript_29770/g.68718 Transcript_29770/m.68718 type:complete len:113 (-) Transcript_29770:243-581(-)